MTDFRHLVLSLDDPLHLDPGASGESDDQRQTVLRRAQAICRVEVGALA